MDKQQEAIFDEIVEKYQGTCNSISYKDSDFLYENGLWDEMDNIQKYCNQCNWWNCVSDMREGIGDGDVCSECYEENKEEIDAV
ncbi:MAG: hypothetical protein GY810_01180 [Aureispira sp.]|nr:hypothetical protein [Aureispira sp.]